MYLICNDSLQYVAHEDELQAKTIIDKMIKCCFLRVHLLLIYTWIGDESFNYQYYQ